MITKYKDYIKENMTSKITLEQVIIFIKDFFNDDKVSYIDWVYEKDEKYTKLVIIINNLFYNDVNIFYTKLIFYVDKTKTILVRDKFSYLYDINCNFKKIYFNTFDDLKDKFTTIFNDRQFGDDIKYLSDFNTSPSTFINEWLTENDVTNFSVFNIEFKPDVKIIPCESLYFKFNINIEDKTYIDLIIKKIDGKYKFIFNINDKELEVEKDDIKNIVEVIGQTLKNNIK